MDAMQLANAMMFVDSMRMQHEQIRRMNEYEWMHRMGTHSYNIGKRPPAYTKPLFGDMHRNVEDIVEFPIRSYDVLAKKDRGFLDIRGHFILCIEQEGFDWSYYRERIQKGLKACLAPQGSFLISYLPEKSSLVPVLEEIGFTKEPKEDGMVRMAIGDVVYA